MGQSKPFRATALIVEDDPMQRDMICLLLEESEVDVIECESAEAAELVLERAADAAGGAGYGGRASGYRSHFGELLAGRERAGSREVSQIGTEP